MPPHSPSSHPDSDIDLRQLISVFLRHKGIILALIIAGTAIGLGVSVLSAKYVSEGLFLTPSVSVADYKRLETAFLSRARLQQFLQISNKNTTPEGALFAELLHDPTALSNVLAPEFALTSKDQKMFGVNVAEQDDTGKMVGVRIRFTHKTPTEGAGVTLLSEYVRDTVIRVKFEDDMLARCAEYRTREQELRNEQLADEFSIAQEEKRLATLRAIVARTPATAPTDNRPFLSLEKGSERFLSPAAQLVAAEVKIADLKLAEAQRVRLRVESALKRDYYCRASQALKEPTTGRAFLESLKNIQATSFQHHDKNTGVVEQTWNELDVERARWTNTYLSGMRFVASPKGTEFRQRRPGLVLGGILGGMAGFMVALVRAWWRSSRDERLTPND